MGRIRQKTLFNKCHITITKEENLPSDESNGAYYYNKEVNTKTVRGSVKSYKDEYKKVTKVSPLGFYYETIERTPRIPYHDYDILGRILYYIIEIKNGTTRYSLKYCHSYGSSNMIGIDKRPWEIVPGDEGLNDNMVQSLLSDVNIMFQFASDNKIKTYSNRSNNNLPISNLKDMVYKDLFGSKDGIKFQTDSEKIVSHGFDLKESFRKGKE